MSSRPLSSTRPMTRCDLLSPSFDLAASLAPFLMAGDLRPAPLDAQTPRGAFLETFAYPLEAAQPDTQPTPWQLSVDGDDDELEDEDFLDDEDEDDLYDDEDEEDDDDFLVDDDEEDDDVLDDDDDDEDYDDLDDDDL